MKKHIRISVSLILLFTLCLSLCITALAADATVCLGADLSAEQRATTLAILGLQEVPTDAVYVTNQDERDLLGGFIPIEQIGSRALSSAKVTLNDNETGITVTTHNITWCTSAMYIAALATAGVKNADVVVAAPMQVSGTAALAGIFKAYEQAADVTLSDVAKAVGGEELAITGQLAEYLGTDEAVALIGRVKQEIVEQGLDNEEAIRPAIENAARELNLQISQSQIDMLVSFALKIFELDMDPQQIADQAQGILRTIENLQKAQEATSGFFQSVSTSFNAVVDWFKGLFGG